MALKKKIAEEPDNFDDSHLYRCFKCGAEYENPTGNFYKSKWSPAFVMNSRYAPLCIKCVKSMFSEYERKYGTENACIFMCYRLDIPFYYTLFDSIVKNNNTFNMGLYVRQLNNQQYRFQDFSQSILTGEIAKTFAENEKEKEIRWSKQDKQNRDYAIEILGYDPFDEYPEEDRRFLFNQLSPYLEDETTIEDPYKLSQILQIVNNNKQIYLCDKKISRLDIVKNATDIIALNEIKRSLVANNDKIAKENEISVKNRSNKDVGKSTLTYLMKDLREKNIKKAEADYYDQLRSEGTQWAVSVSQKAMLDHCLFDENDKREVYQEQLTLIDSLYKQLDDEKEKCRQLHETIDTMKVKIQELGGEV